MAAMPLRLWEVNDALDALTLEIFESGGEITPEIEAQLDALEEGFLEKVERIALRVRELEVTAAAAKAEKDRLAAIQKTNENAAKGLKHYLMEQMGRKGQDRVETMKCRVRVQKNPSPSISWTGEAEDIPEDYRKVEIKPDLAALKADLKEGAALPEGFVATFGSHLRIS